MIPARFAPVLFGFILSGLMSCMVSFIATVRMLDGTTPLIGAWMSAWIFSWVIAFPVVLFVAPITRRIVAKLVTPQ